MCVIDSGFNQGHEDLPATFVTGTNNSGTGNWSQDRCGHGTHVSGTIAAVSNDVGVVGVLPGGNLPMHIVKVFGDSRRLHGQHRRPRRRQLHVSRVRGRDLHLFQQRDDQLLDRDPRE